MDRILADRENRYYRILKLINKYKLPVLCGKINYPGKDKQTVESKKAFSILKNILSSRLAKESVFSEELEGYDGSSILMVMDMEPAKAKNIAVSIEETHRLGRIFDIDIYMDGGIPVDRKSVDKEPRKCIICNEDARLCIRAKKHKLEDIIDKVNSLIDGII